jgi:hypothetical protein
MDLLVLDTAIPYKRLSTLKKHITDFGTFPHFILTCIKICFSLLLQYVFIIYYLLFYYIICERDTASF